MPIKDLTGKKFNRLTVISFAESRKGRGYWNCVCDCGNSTIVCTRDLTSSRIKSCGCLSKGAKYVIHNLSHTRLYHIYKGMKGRCYNPNNKDYHNYGARGIGICSEWLLDFVNFYNWAIHNGYKETLSIDRIDNNKSYSPTNCRWVGVKEQSNNRRTNKYLEYNGKKQTLSEWAKEVGIDKTLLRTRLNRGWSPKDALFYPANSKAPLKIRKQKEH